MRQWSLGWSIRDIFTAQVYCSLHYKSSALTVACAVAENSSWRLIVTCQSWQGDEKWHNSPWLMTHYLMDDVCIFVFLCSHLTSGKLPRWSLKWPPYFTWNPTKAELNHRTAHNPSLKYLLTPCTIAAIWHDRHIQTAGGHPIRQNKDEQRRERDTHTHNAYPASYFLCIQLTPYLLPTST